MTSKEVAALVGVSHKSGSIQRLTKKALSNNQPFITVKGVTFNYEVVSGAYGKSYNYTEVKAQKKENKKSVYQSKIKSLDLLEIEHIDLSKTTTQDEKLLIIKFYKTHNYSLNSIVKSLFLIHHKDNDEKSVKSAVRKVQRWLKDFKENGAKALEDTRGKSTDFRKIDVELLDSAIMAAKNRANHQGFYSVWDFYCFAKARKDGVIDTASRAYKKEKIISYSAIIAATKKRLYECYGVKVFDDKGFDGWLQGYVVGVRDISYTNQEWQVDATKFDFICKIPNDESPTGYDIGRVNFTTVIDVHTGAVVGNLTQTLNSYDQIRVLYKAFEKMGKPEILKTDNGKDYASNHYQRVVSDLGITQSFAQVGQGRQKGSVERFFNTFQTQYSMIPGYVGSSVEYRVKIENQNASKIDIRTSKATRFDTDRLLTLDELRKITDTLLAKYVDNYSEFDQFLLSDAELADIRIKLGKKHTRKLSMEGIRLNNTTYQGSDIWLNGLNKGDWVEVYENIDDVNQVWIYKDDNYIGVAKNVELGLEAMSIEEYKASVKAHKKNHITPFVQKQKEAMKLYHEYQDEFVKGTLEEQAMYQSNSPKPKTIPSKVSSTSPSNQKSVTRDINDLVAIAGY